MVIEMNDARLGTVEQIRDFLASTAEFSFSVASDDAERRQFVVNTVRRFGYFKLPKKQRGVLFAYLERLTSYSRQHLSRLLVQYRASGSLQMRKRASRTSFAAKYGPADVRLLAELDNLHDTLSGPATRVLAARAYRAVR